MNRRAFELPRVAILLIDGCAAVLAGLAAYWLRFEAGLLPVEGARVALPARYAEALPIVVTVFVSVAAGCGWLRRDHLFASVPFREAIRVGALSATALAVLTLLYWKEFQYSRLAVGLAGGAYALTFPIGRAVAHSALSRVRRRASWGTPAVLVGCGDSAARFARTVLADPHVSVRLEALVPLGGSVPPELESIPLLELDALATRLARTSPPDVYVALPASRAAELPALLDRLADSTAGLHVIPDLGERPVVQPEATVLHGVTILSLRQRPLFGLRALCKRGLDVVLSGALLLLLAPGLALIAALVRLTSPGPVLYLQERMGLDGAPFRMLKFRTMRVDAEEGTGPVFTRPGDPRTTGVGRILRRFSLDELPQLWNVLRGDMSLVGPRPERPSFIAEFRNLFPGYMLRHSMRSGMTGWAQIHGLRGDTSLQERLRYDLEYIDRWSLLLDLEILGRTALQVVLGRNAY